MQIRCPHCRNAIEMVLEDPSNEVSCPSCGSSFNLAKDGLTLTTDGPPAKMLGHFQLLHCLGQGAFGTVWKARDTELDRIVAIKIPRKENLTEADAEKFLREARAAAQVRHPNIVSVHEVGREDGSIYIASDFIDGASLDEWVQAHPLTVRESVELCAKIAEALHHAHEAGVVHRDLKPQNILVQSRLGLRPDPIPNDSVNPSAKSGRDGVPTYNPHASTLTPFITDFGLAKRDAGEITMTVEGAILGTPAYMPPEQARGEAHHADRRSDVYSLGVILFRLLTGELPFRGQRQMLIVQILNEEPPALRKLDARLPRDVETICLKCLEKDPARRYQSAAALAADLRRWLTGHPIEARPVSRTERAWRWCHRNPAAASAIAAVVVGLVSVSWLSAVLWNKNEQLKTTNEDLRLSKQAETTAKDKAEANAAVASEQTQLALKSLETIIFDIQSGLQNVPGAGEVQKKLLLTALDQLKKVSAAFASRSAIDRNTMAALGELGDLLMRIGADEGSAVETARDLYTRAHEIAQTLAAADPSDTQLQSVVFVTYCKLGDVHRQLGRLNKALEYYQQALAISHKLAVSDPSFSYLSISYNRLGDVQLQSGQMTEAAVSYQRAMEIRQKLAAVDPSDTQAQLDLAVSYHGLGNVQRRSGQLTEALRSSQKLIEISQKLAVADPSDAQAQRNLSVSYNMLGDVELQTGQLTKALGSYQKGLEIAEKLYAADPNHTQAQRDLSFSYNSLGDVQHQSGQLSEALGSYHKALEIRQKLASADPSNTQVQHDLSVSYNNLGDVQLQSAQVTEALESYQMALEICQKLAAADSSNAEVQRDLFISYGKLGDVQLKFGMVAEALRSYQKGLEVNQKMAAANPSDARAQSDLTVSYDNLGNVQLKSGQVTEALGSYRKSLEIRQSLAEVDPSNTQNMRGLSHSYDHLGDVQLQTGQVTEALASYQNSLDIRQKLLAADLSHAQAKRDLSVSYNKLGDVQLKSSQVIEALGSFQKGLEIRKSLAEVDPSDTQAQRDLSTSYLNLGDVQRKSGQVAESLESYQKCLDIFQKLSVADPSNAQAQRDLSVAHNHLGDAQLQLRDVTEALVSYQKAFEIRQKLASADPLNAEAQVDLHIAFHRLAIVMQRSRQYQSAIAWYQKSKEVLEKLQADNKLPFAHRACLAKHETEIAKCRNASTALGDWNALLEQPEDVLPALLEMRGGEFVQAGRFADAVQAVAKLRELRTATADQLYNAACVYSLCAAGIKAPKDELTTEQATERKKHIDNALETLREAIKAGWKDFAHMQKDPELNVLRDLPEFRAFIPQEK